MKKTLITLSAKDRKDQFRFSNVVTRLLNRKNLSRAKSLRFDDPIIRALSGIFNYLPNHFESDKNLGLNTHIMQTINDSAKRYVDYQEFYDVIHDALKEDISSDVFQQLLYQAIDSSNEKYIIISDTNTLDRDNAVSSLKRLLGDKRIHFAIDESIINSSRKTYYLLEKEDSAYINEIAYYLNKENLI